MSTIPSSSMNMNNTNSNSNVLKVLPKSNINMTADFNRAVYVNNEGTRLVKQCQYDEAVKSFTTVLKILKPLAAIVENNAAQAHQNQNANNATTTRSSSTNTESEYTSSSSSTTTTSTTSIPLTISFTNSSNNHLSSTTMVADSSSTTNTNNPTMTDTSMAQIHPPPPSPSAVSSAVPVPVRSYSLSEEEEEQQQQQQQLQKEEEEKKKAVAAQLKLVLASKQHHHTSDKFARNKPSYFVFREPVEIPPGSVQRKKRKATSMRMSMIDDDDEMDDDEDDDYVMDAVDQDENENETLEDELLYYTPGLFSKFLMVTMYNLALTLHLHALSLSTSLPTASTPCSKYNNNDTNDMKKKKMKKLFLRSRKLYELSFEMHLDESCDVNLLFTLALINNLGLVYNTLNENKRSITCFKNMFSTMMYLMDTNESSTINEWDGLISNVMDILFYNNNSSDDCTMYEVVAPAA
jgi:hypothetical protein